MSTLSTPEVKGSTATKGVWGLVPLAVQNGWALSAWRLPGDHDFTVTIDTSGGSAISSIDLESLPPGYLFCPFEGGSRMFLRSDATIRTGANQAEFNEAISAQDQREIENVLRQTDDQKNVPLHLPESQDRPTDRDQETYQDIIAEAVTRIKKGEMEKVVPSRTRSIDLPADFQIPSYFQALSKRYPNAFVSLTSVPGVGTWIGATPELLLEVLEHRRFRTISLAGTQKAQQGLATEAVAWTQKDIEEQALVSRYIINCFKHIRLREFEEHGPKTVVAGNLMHLKTSFEVDMEKTGFHNLGSTMLNLLHPTSAVCGMPREAAMEFIHEHENHDRGYYSGFLGPVNQKSNTHLYVNLRCMQLQEGSAILYAGAGVTEDSLPSKEWDETNMKLDTLLEAL